MRQIDREILSLTIPSIITNITTPLLALMDVAIVGHLGNATYLAAIAVGGTVFNMIYWLFAFLRMGTSGLSAQAHGSGEGRELDLVLERGVVVALGAGVLIVALSYPLQLIAFMIMDVDGESARLAGRYFEILVWGAPAVLLTYTFTGWTLGRKNSRAPMWVAFIINISNIAVSLALVVGLKMKIEGVALGTLSAQWLGAIVFGLMIARRYRPRLYGLSEVIDRKALGRFFRVNSDIFLRTVCLVAVTVWFTRCGASPGTLMLAVNTLMMQFFMFFSYFMDGFAFAGESLCGNSYGERNTKKLRLTVKALMQWGAGVAGVFTVVYFLGGEWIVGLLSDEAEVLSAAGEYLGWVVV
ncbi:MAG: MATE family efflux transporter, partial [Duncaniella sp.]|nr:MATE family efflux transporter [Duncaniella sp.]